MQTKPLRVAARALKSPRLETPAQFAITNRCSDASDQHEKLGAFQIVILILSIISGCFQSLRLLYTGAALVGRG